MITVTLDSSLYPPHCVEAAVSAFPQFTIRATAGPRDTYLLIPETDANANLVDEVLNHVLMRCIEDHLTQNANE